MGPHPRGPYCTGYISQCWFLLQLWIVF